MKRLLNTLYVTTQGSYLTRDGETIHVRVENETRLRVPIHTLGSVVCMGNVMCSPPLMGLCAERNVTLSFLTEYGRFLARVHGPVSGNVLLRREQYRKADSETASADIARAAVSGKIANARTVLQRAARDRPDDPNVPALLQSAHRMMQTLESLQKAESLDSVRGLEGEAARDYFSAFDHLITAQKDHFFFLERSRRPPLDNLNALLSFLYVLLVHDVTAALETVGLDPQVGFLHRDRSGRPGLALDLMEELRPFLADRLALSLINRRQIQAKGFHTTETGAVLMNDGTRKTVLTAYQERKQDEILHPFIGEKAPIGLLPHLQALLLSRHIRGDLDGYPPFIWK